MLKRHTAIVAASFVGALLLSVHAVRAADAIKLDETYHDSVNGFQIRPPADTERSREPSPSRLVTWSSRDRKTGAIGWTLSVLRIIQKTPITDFRDYADQLGTKLQRDEGFVLESNTVIPVGGRNAIDIRGATGGGLKRWQRQVWVQADKHMFLVFTVSGMPEQKAELERVAAAVVPTIRVMDPETLMRHREENLKAGKEFLASLTGEKLTAAADGKMRWHQFLQDGKAIGFTAMQAKMVDKGGLQGVEVRTWSLIRAPNGARQMEARILFAEPKRVLEDFAEQGVAIERDKTVRLTVHGMMTNGTKISCDISRDGEKVNKEASLPKDIYLPRAFGVLLPRLVDLKTERTYGFAAYDVGTNQFDYHTFSVVGPTEVEIGGRKVAAVKVVQPLLSKTIAA